MWTILGLVFNFLEKCNKGFDQRLCILLSVSQSRNPRIGVVVLEISITFRSFSIRDLWELRPRSFGKIKGLSNLLVAICEGFSLRSLLPGLCSSCSIAVIKWDVAGFCSC